jgi:hypothetical protein
MYSEVAASPTIEANGFVSLTVDSQGRLCIYIPEAPPSRATAAGTAGAVVGTLAAATGKTTYSQNATPSSAACEIDALYLCPAYLGGCLRICRAYPSIACTALAL